MYAHLQMPQFLFTYQSIQTNCAGTSRVCVHALLHTMSCVLCVPREFSRSRWPCVWIAISLAFSWPCRVNSWRWGGRFSCLGKSPQPFFTPSPRPTARCSRDKRLMARSSGRYAEVGVKARLPVTRPNFSMTMKKLARGYRQSRSKSG
jgi:hypothetical protein